MYSNVGQASAGTLVAVAVADNVEWSALGDPWVDGNTVGVYGNLLVPSSQQTILLWNGATGAESLVNPGSGYIVAYNSQASLSGSAAILGRTNTGANEMGISYGSSFETLATAGVTSMPGLGLPFDAFYKYPVVNKNGQDAAFLGRGGGKQGLFKRVNGGALQNVADTTTPVPEVGGELFKLIWESTIALANGQMVFAVPPRPKCTPRSSPAPNHRPRRHPPHPECSWLPLSSA